MATKGKSRQAKAKKTNSRVRKLTPKQAEAKAKKEISKQPLANSFGLAAHSVQIFRKFWKPFIGVLLIYLVLNVLFASGISSLSATVSSIKADLNNTSLNAHPLLAATTGFLVLVTSAGASSSSTGALLQAILILVESLVIIWMLRQLLAGKTIGIREAYYNSMYPLVKFVLILLLIFLQLLPITLGATILSAIASALGTISGFWTVAFSLIFIALASWSVYMLSSSIFALYIVTLPNMQPLQAVRAAKNLVRFRRWPVIRRVLFLPVLLLVAIGVVTIPLALYATWFVAPIFYILGARALWFAHTYLYSLYRELLG